MNSTPSRGFRRTALAIAALTAFAGTAALQSTDAFAAGSAAVMPLVAHATQLHPGDKIHGVLPDSQPMHIVVALKMRNRAQLDGVIAAHHVLTPGQFAAQHAPTVTQANAVAKYLKLMGFKNVEIAPNRMMISADGNASNARGAFLTSFASVQKPDGRMAFANDTAAHIPTALQDSVLSVIGLQTVHLMHTFARVQPGGGAHTQAVTGHLPNEFSSIYSGSGVATGAGVTVGIITQGKITQTITDLNTFTNAHGFATVTTQTVNTGGTSSDASGVGEWNLDSQDVVGMAGGAVGKIIFYNEPTLSNADLSANINAAVSANAAKIINMSLGECETYTQQDGSQAADDQSFATGVAQGQTFSISTGDSGADECADGAHTPSSPANSPYVIAVAGTTLNASTTSWSSETVWNGSGGSESLYEPKPSWQTLWSGSHRGVADVAFDADPNSGAKVYVNGALQQIGGTSLAAPIFAGMWARVIAVKGTSVGFAGPLIYQLPASDFHDVTSGSNGISAGVGYDLASGRGSMILSSAITHIGGGGGNTPPTANFSFTTSGLTATFTDSSSDSDGSISSHAWTFGDGTTSTSTNPSHTYSASGTYSVTETVTDNGGATNSKTSSVAVSGGGGGGGTVLSNGVAVTGLAATAGNSLNYTMVVPAGATGLSFVQSGGTGDSDMYVKFGSAPTDTVYDCRPYVSGNAETCNIATAQAGTYYVRLKAYSSFTGVSIKGSYTAGGGGGCVPSGTVLCSGTQVTLPSVATGGVSSNYTIVVPAGKSSLVVNIASGTGDADLYVKAGSAPTTSSYTCRPYTSSSTETCTINSPAAGTYYINVRAYAAFSGETLKATIN